MIVFFKPIIIIIIVVLQSPSKTWGQGVGPFATNK